MDVLSPTLGCVISDCGGRREARPCRSADSADLTQAILDLVDAGLGAGLVLVEAGRAGVADGADEIVAGPDRHATARHQDVVDVLHAGDFGALLDGGCPCRGWPVERRGREGLAEGAVDGVRARAVAAQAD